MTKQQIEKAAKEYAEGFIGSTERKYRKSAFADGASFALSQRWVSVDERLPEDDRCFYFVADARLNPLGVDCAEYDCETKLFSRNGHILHPTHWCHIPQLTPEKEER